MVAIAPHFNQKIAGFMPRRNLLVPTVCIVVLLFVWTFRLPSSSFPWMSSGGGSGALSHKTGAHGGTDLSSPEAPFIGWPLQRVCEETTYVEGLVYICDNNSGGIGNVRNYIQTCLRYALEAGATGLVVPRIRRRSDKDLADLFTEYRPFSYMFDEQHFKSVFNTYCPKIAIYDHVVDIPYVVKELHEKPRIEEIVPKDFGDRKGCDWKDQNRHTDRFGNTFRAWVNDAEHGVPPSKTSPRLIRFKWGVLWDWPIYRDGPEFVATFGSVLKFNKELLRLGKATLKNMQGFARSKGARNGEFLGVHLRTENDAMGFWPTYETQAGGYIQKAQEKGFKAAYLATGNLTEAQKFATEMGQITTVTKSDLLTGKELEALNSLTWDQQGLVDFIVLLASDFFVGTMPSSFSVYMAMKRHLKTGGLYTRPYKTGTEGDGLSYLVGNYKLYWEDWLFMWDGMWP